MTEAIELPVIAKEPVRTHTGSAATKLVPRRKFDSDFVRVKGNIKTEANVTDTTKGCAGGCYGCYAARSMGTHMGQRLFHVPVSQVLVPEMLQYDLLKMVEKDKNLDWLRNGVMGDPSYDWEAAVEAAEAAALVGIRNVIISKWWTMPTDEQLMRLALSGAVLHFSLIPGYEWAPDISVGKAENNRMRDIVSALLKYDKMTKPNGLPVDAKNDNIVIRLCTALFNRETWEGRAMDDTQEYFRVLTEKMGWRVLETPWRFEGPSDPRWEFLDHTGLKKKKSYATGKDGRQVTAGSLVFDGDKYADWKTFAIACDTTCDVCPNQCGTMSREPIHIVDGVAKVKV